MDQTTTTSGHRLRALAITLASPFEARKGLGRIRIENKSSSPNGANTVKVSFSSKRTATAKAGDAKRVKAAAAQGKGS